LNYAVGGLNPDAVISAYRLGGKYIWLPNMDARHHRVVVGEEGGIELLDKNGNVVPDLKEILTLTAETDMVLGLGHNSTKERFTVVEEALKMGLKRIEVTHVNYPITKMTPQQAKILADKGAFIGIYVMQFQPPIFYMEEALDFIRVVGPDHIIIASDCGHFEFPPPVHGLRLMITELLLRGIPDNDVERMVKTNPTTLVY
jgi:predicted metal-dependent TIM-barrel fold hydrolase